MSDRVDSTLDLVGGLYGLRTQRLPDGSWSLLYKPPGTTEWRAAGVYRGSQRAAETYLWGLTARYDFMIPAQAVPRRAAQRKASAVVQARRTFVYRGKAGLVRPLGARLTRTHWEFWWGNTRVGQTARQCGVKIAVRNAKRLISARLRQGAL